MGVEGKEAPASGPGPHRTSSRSVRALGFSRYFSRARQAEMRSGLSSILPRADKGEFILGALASASWVSSTHHVQLGCSQRVSTLCPVALTQSCQGSPEWWNLRPPSFSDTFTRHPKGQTWGTHRPQEKMETWVKLYSKWPVADGNLFLRMDFSSRVEIGDIRRMDRWGKMSQRRWVT